jgi:glutathione S-transferase
MLVTRYRLYGESLWISPYVFSCFVALTEKGVPFDVAEIRLFDGEHLAPEYRDRSLTARVPTLVHEDFSLSESSAIDEYLEELLPPPEHPPLLPASRQARARARQLMAFLRSDLDHLRAERSTVTMFYRFKLGPLSPAAARDAEKLIRVAETLVPANNGSLFGAWTIADAELAFVLHRLVLARDPVPARIATYAAGQWQRPSVRAFVEHPRPAAVPERYWAYAGTPRPEPAA